jgi:hypothetical protein
MMCATVVLPTWQWQALRSLSAALWSVINFRCDYSVSSDAAALTDSVHAWRTESNLFFSDGPDRMVTGPAPPGECVPVVAFTVSNRSQLGPASVQNHGGPGPACFIATHVGRSPGFRNSHLQERAAQTFSGQSLVDETGVIHSY